MARRLAAALAAAGAALAAATAPSPSAVLVQLDAGVLVQLDAWCGDSIRVRAAPPGVAIGEPPLQALLPDCSGARAAAEAVTATPSSLRNGNLNVTVDPATGFVTAVRVSDGRVLLQQTALSFTAATAPGVRNGSVTAVVSFAGNGPSERLYGFGEHRNNQAAGGNATVNMLPFSQSFQVSQNYGISHGSDVSIPWYTSSRGYGFLLNLPGYGVVNASASGVTWSINATMNVDMWLTTTPADADPAVSPHVYLLGRYIDAVGHAGPMPGYLTGFIQSKNRYRNQSQLLDVARGYASRGIPVSVAVIDYKHWHLMGDFTFSPECWPDPQAMVDELKSLGIEPMVTFWPFVAPNCTHWDSFTSSGFVAPLLDGSLAQYDDWCNGYLIDQTQAAARQAFFQAFMDGYGKYGFKAVWLDGSEPERPNAAHQGDIRLSLGTDTEIGAAWVQQHIRALTDGFSSIGVSDYFLLPRSHWAGVWRGGAIGVWSGDTQSTWQEFNAQVRVLQGAMMSGVALWSSDTGGYANGNLTDPSFQELVVRWLQFSVFSPLFRLHGKRLGGPDPDPVCGATDGDNEIWTLAATPEQYNAMVAAVGLREDLREYTAIINAQTVATGLPMARPLFLEFPLDAASESLDPAVGDVTDEFMYGSAWLVAPVLQLGATNRSVYLPPLNATAGESWTHWWTQKSYGAGGQRVTVPVTSLLDFPLFFRESPATDKYRLPVRPPPAATEVGAPVALQAGKRAVLA